MADYFEEMGWEPLQDGASPNHYLHMARLFRDMNMFQELGMEQKLPPPASKEFVKSLPLITIEESGVQCPICLKDFEEQQKAIEVPCQHKYHQECILPWLTKTNSCPLCRYELPTDNETYELYKKEKIRAAKRKEEIEVLHNSMFS